MDAKKNTSTREMPQSIPSPGKYGESFAERIKRGGADRRAALKEAALRAAKAGAMFIAAFVLARGALPFSVYPFGIMLVCALPVLTLEAAAGLAAGGISLGGFGYAYAASAVIILASRFAAARFLCREERRTFEEPVQFRMACACVAGMGIGISSLISSGFSTYDTYGAVLLILLCPAGTLLFSFPFVKAFYKTTVFYVGIASLTAALIYCLRPVAPAGIPLAFACAVLLALAASDEGPLYGLLAGLAFGLAADVFYSPAAALAGLACALIKKRSPGMRCWLGALASGAFCLAAGGVTGFIEMASACGAGALGGFVCLRYDLAAGLLPETTAIKQELSPGVSEAEADTRAVSEALGYLSEVFYAMSDRSRRIDYYEFRDIMDIACDKFCSRCKNSSLCWEREYTSTADAVFKAARKLTEGKSLSPSDFPAYLSERCRRLSDITAEANARSLELTERKLRGDGTEVIALDYQLISKLLSDTMEDTRREGVRDDLLSAKLKEELKRRGVPFRGAGVWGKRRKNVRVWGPSALASCFSVLKSAAEEVCCCAMSSPELKTDASSVIVIMSARRSFVTESFFALSPKEAGQACGDSISTFENKEDFFYALISDGMGSGAKAADASSVCGIFLKKMLTAGNKRDAALNMLNAAFSAGGDDVCATVDLFELDLLSGKASFVKSGAAPSYVRRGGKLFRIQSKTMPVGVVRALEAEQVAFNTVDGDIIIMLSDGIAQSYGDISWLTRLLSAGWEDNLRAMSKKILDAAKRNCEKSDDMSVLLIRINEER